jgi:23S rRNA pseudouridine1911/1915/1917 synthase
MKLIAPELATKPRTDAYLAGAIPNVSRSFIDKLCEQGKVSVNGDIVPGRYRLKPGDEILLDYDFNQAKLIPEIELPILFENDDCIVIEKPAGLLTHSKGAFNPEATVATFIRTKISGFAQDDDRAGIVHRLDRGTSGVILCAKTPETLTWFQKQFSDRKVKKTYYAVIKGTLDPKEALIDVPIGRNPRNPKMFYPTIHGKIATTHYKVIKTNQKYSLIELKPETGRTHQLRVHLQHIKHSIVGDDFYGGEPADRLYLHAGSLEITLPGGDRRVFESKLPEAFDTKV